MSKLERTKALKGAKDTAFAKGRAERENRGPDVPQAGQTGPIVQIERGGLKARRTRTYRASRTPSNLEVERPGTLTARQILALQKAYRAGISMEKCAEYFGLALSTVSKYCSGLEHTNFDKTAANVTSPSLTSPGNGGDLESPQPLQLQAVEPDLQVPSKDQSPKPELMRSAMNGADELSRIFADAALSRGYLSVRDYVSEVILPDVRFAGLVKEAIPHVDMDSLERNFLATVEDANAFRRLTRASREEARREMEKRKDGSST